MKTLNLKQGDKNWHDHRVKHYNASEAPAMMGVSSYCTRDELLAMKKFGVEKDINPALQAIFNKGHENEANARPIAELIIGAELYPVTGFDEIQGMPLSASFDGLTMLEDINWEHKSINQALRDTPNVESLDLQYKVQMEQQMLLSGAERSLFMASNGTIGDKVEFWYEPDMKLRTDIIEGWKQFKKDLETFEMPETKNKAVAKSIEPLPVLVVGVAGEITTTNIEEFEATAQMFIAGIKTDLQTDDDFADAEKTVKFCASAEKQIKAVKQQAVDQMADVSMIFKKMDAIIEQLRDNRLSLDKSVKNEKDKRRAEIVQDGRNELAEVLIGCKTRLCGTYIGHDANFESVIKGKKSIDAMRSAINDEVARCKIKITSDEDNVSSNIKAINGLSTEFGDLFPDLKYVVIKPHEEVSMIIDNRILKFNEAVRLKEEADAQKLKDEAEAARLKEEEVKDVVIPASKTASKQKQVIKTSTKAAKENAAALKARLPEDMMVMAYVDELVNVCPPDVEAPELVAVLRAVLLQLSDIREYVLQNTQG